MGFRPNEFLEKMSKGLPRIEEFNRDFYKTVKDQEAIVFRDGAMSKKQKELMAIALSLVIKCPYCIPYHVKNAVEAGATYEELMETSEVAIAMGGLPATTYTTMMLEAYDELKK